MMYVKICECCGNRFFSKSNLKKYCSKVCAREMAQRQKEEDEQPCWRCKKACGGCGWSKCFIPVKGWDATFTIIKDSEGEITSYKIHKCPEFIKI